MPRRSNKGPDGGGFLRGGEAAQQALLPRRPRARALAAYQQIEHETFQAVMFELFRQPAPLQALRKIKSSSGYITFAQVAWRSRCEQRVRASLRLHHLRAVLARGEGVARASPAR